MEVVSMRFPFQIILLILIVLLCSCSSSSGGNPVAPDSTGGQQNLSQNDEPTPSERYLWGLYLFEYDPDTNEVKIIPARQGSDHWNILFFLEGWPCTNCVRVIAATPTPDDTINFTVEITHPFDSMNFTGFDVRGIAMFEGGYEFPEMYYQVPDASAGTGELMNPDGFTALYAWWTVSFGPPVAQGYIPGRFSSPISPSASVNGYKRFISPGAENTRRAFYAGDILTNTFEIDMPDDTFIFGYAVDASWVSATDKPVDDPIADFPPEANCPEPYRIDITVDPIGPGLNLGGGATELIIDVYDGVPETHYAPEITCPGIFAGIETAALVTHFPTFSRYRVVVSNVGNPSPIEGEFPVLVRVRDELYGTTDDWIDLTAYALTSVTVSDISHGGWARTWGGTVTDGIAAVAADLHGNIYVGGYFIGTVDFDPGPGVDERTSVSDSADAYLTRYDNMGNYQHTLVWGGGGTDGVNGIAIDSDGNIICVGQWEAGIDLDPDPDETWQYLSVGNPEGFISKFNAGGDFLWGQKIWGSGGDVAYEVDTDLSNNIYVTGTFENSATFDQWETELYTSNGEKDAFLAKYGANGDILWGVTLGSDSYDYGYDLVTGGNDYIIWVGAFAENDGGGGVDFDPSDSLTDYHYSNGNLDAFLIRYNPSGNYEYGESFGGTGSDNCNSVGIRSDFVYACGSFTGEVDFVPGPGFDIRTSNGSYDAWLTQFNFELTQLWTDTWGGPDGDSADALALDSYGGLYVAGTFRDTVDFDPGFDTENRTSAGSIDAYLLKLNTGGDFDWVRTIGSTDTDRATDVAVGEYAFPYMVGTISGTVDFAPPTASSDPHSSVGSWDPFLVRYLLNGEW